MITVGFIIAYHQKLILPLILSIVGALVWICAQNFEWLRVVDASSIGLVAIIFFSLTIFYFLGKIHLLNSKYLRFGNSYICLSLIISLMLLLFYTTNFGTGQFINSFAGKSLFKSYEASLMHYLSFTMIIIIIGYAYIKKIVSIFEVFLAGIITVFFGLMTIIPQTYIKEFFIIQSSIGRSLFDNQSIIVPLFFSIIFLLESVGTIYLALTKNTKWILDIGLVFLYIFVVIKIFEIFFYLWSFNLNGIINIVSLILISTILKIIENYKSQIDIKSYVKVLNYLTTIFITLFLLIISNHSWTINIMESVKAYSQFGNIQTSIATFAFLLLTILGIYYASYIKVVHQIETTFFIIFILFLGIIINFPIAINDFNTLILSFILTAIALANIVIMIFKGFYYQNNALINIGAFFMFIFIFFKYFDWFYSFMDKSIFFLIAGAMLFILGFFMEKGRRYMLSNIKKEI